MGKHLIFAFGKNCLSKAVSERLETDAECEVLAFEGRPEELRELEGRSQLLCIFVRVNLGEKKGMRLFEAIQKRCASVPIVVVGESSDSRAAIAAIKAGAYDFLEAPAKIAEVRAIIEALGRRADHSAGSEVLQPLKLEGTMDELVGRSQAMVEVYKTLGRLSPTPVTVLIRGETGTGKELIARALHRHGHRAHRPLVTVNCAAIPEKLIESELFGHEQGAFTGAHKRHIGKFEQAHEATLFLDEIGDLDLSLQAKLLRVLQERQIQRVGGREDIPVDVRILAATHKPLEAMIERGEFREDLFFRLNVATVRLPPLRDRLGDVALLSVHFLEQACRELSMPPVGLTRNALSRLERDPLRGNVRQLQNMIRKAVLQSRGYPINESLIASLLNEAGQGGGARVSDARKNVSRDSGEGRGGHVSADEAGPSLTVLCEELLAEAADGQISGALAEITEMVEEHLIEAALKRAEGNISQSARWIGWSRLTLREKMKRYDIENTWRRG